MPCPGAPRPLTRMRWPSSTPAGMRTLTERTFCSVPVPWQTGHGVSKSVPRPTQSGQTVLSENRPWLSFRLPVPPQRGQVCVEVPGAAPLPRQFEHRTSWGTLTEVVTPCTASWKDRCSCASMSAPRWGPRWVGRVPAAAEETPEEVAQVAHVLHAEGAAAGRAEAAADRARGCGPRRTPCASRRRPARRRPR